MISIIGSSILTAISYSSYLSARKEYDSVAQATELKDLSERGNKYITGVFESEIPIEHNSERYITLRTNSHDVIERVNVFDTRIRLSNITMNHSTDFKTVQTFLKGGISINVSNLLSELHDRFSEDAGKRFIPSENSENVGWSLDIGLFGVQGETRRRIGQKFTYKGLKVSPSIYTIVGKYHGSFYKKNELIIRKDMTIEDIRSEMSDRCQSKKNEIAFWILAGIGGCILEEYLKKKQIQLI